MKKDFSIEQTNSILALYDYLKENKQVLNPVNWKRGAVKVNSAIALIPILWSVLSAFGYKFHITQDSAILLCKFSFFVLPIIHNVILSVTSKNISINPMQKHDSSQTNCKEYSHLDSDE